MEPEQLQLYLLQYLLLLWLESSSEFKLNVLAKTFVIFLS